MRLPGINRLTIFAIIFGEILSVSIAPAQSGRSKPDPLGSEQKPPIPCKEDKLESPPSVNVMFNVLVIDSSGRSLQDVAKEDFNIFEDNIPQQITVFEKREGTLNYGLLVDTSGSLRTQFNEVVSAARSLIQANESNDEMFLTRFISSDKIELAQDWTSDQGLAIKRLNDFRIEGGQSAIIDAVYEAAQHLDAHLKSSNVRRRSALVLITDGEDRASYYNENQLFALLGKLDIQVFAIAFANDIEKVSGRARATKLLLALTQRTGGRVVFVSDRKEVSDAVRTIRHELSAQYLIGYESTNKIRDNLVRRIRIEIVDRPIRDHRLAIVRPNYVALCK